jgi:tRNA (cmo5U34)-methyltransferase
MSHIPSDHAKDALYANARDRIVDFVFDNAVVNVFDDMIQRSVPGYATIISLVGLIAERFAQPRACCYDLGCSLGAATLAMRRRIRKPDVKIISIDNSMAMTQRCRENIVADKSTVPVELICADIRNVKIQDAAIVVLNFTMQFIAPDERLDLIKKIYNGLLPAGVLVLSEKIKFTDQQQQTFQEQMHHAFKKANGYSDLEISQKRTALENVLMPDTLEQHAQRFNKVGFRNSFVWFQCFNFASMLAFK